jgi:anti-anti-sigma factor
MTMEIAVTQVQGRVPVAVLRPHGELDASNYRELIASAQQVYQTGTRDILLDLSDVSYMSSSGLVALHRIAVMVRGEDVTEPDSGWEAMRAIRRDVGTGLQRHFKLVNPQPDVDESLEISGFKQFIEVHSDFDAAVASF